LGETGQKTNVQIQKLRQFAEGSHSQQLQVNAEIILKQWTAGSSFS
jgi:hypothetical protein